MAVVYDVASDDARFTVEPIAAKTSAADADVATASFVKGTCSVEMTVAQLTAVRFLGFCTFKKFKLRTDYFLFKFKVEPCSSR